MAHNQTYNQTNNHTHNKGSGIISHILGVLAFIVTCIIAIAFVTSAYAGMVSPLTSRIATLWSMTFPIWFSALAVMLVLDLIWWRRSAIIAILAMLICIPQIWDFCPLNLPKGKMSEDEKEHSFTLMTYNVSQFMNLDKTKDYDYSETLEHILYEEPDMVCIEEASYLQTSPKNRITAEQIERLHDIYPYVYFHRSEFAFLSKFEAEPIPVDFPFQDFASGDVAGWRFVKDGVVINVFGVHLRSYHLDASLKTLWREMTTPETAETKYIKEAKQELAPKVVGAAKERAMQVEIINNILRKYGGETTIVCGDFNDLENSYSVHYLEENCNLRQVYSEVGFGPMITFNANHFFFRIDHILYRGKIKPHSITRGNLKSSDHYPITATFVVDK